MSRRDQEQEVQLTDEEIAEIRAQRSARNKKIAKTTLLAAIAAFPAAYGWSWFATKGDSADQREKILRILKKVGGPEELNKNSSSVPAPEDRAWISRQGPDFFVRGWMGDRLVITLDESISGKAGTEQVVVDSVPFSKAMTEYKRRRSEGSLAMDNILNDLGADAFKKIADAKVKEQKNASIVQPGGSRVATIEPNR